MLHKFRVLKALKGNAMRQTRILLGIKARFRPPVLSLPLDQIVAQHSLICRRLVDLWPDGLSLEGESVCEIGPGDCLASAAFFVAKGARHMDLVEPTPPVVNAQQVRVLAALKEMGFPIATEIITGGDAPAINDSLVSYHTQLMENYQSGNSYGFIFSHNVMEHVEDIASAFKSAYRTLRPGGRMLHYIDLGGHGQFEDPLPPLDFQTYPDWLFGWMYPVNCRNTRQFVGDYRRAALAAGFSSVEIRPVRMAEKSYVESIRPKLRPAARRLPFEELGVVEFALGAVK